MVNDEFDNMDIHFMKLAIGQAKKAAKINEVPIGCVIVYDGKIIGRGYNRRNTDTYDFPFLCIKAECYRVS